MFPGSPTFSSPDRARKKDPNEPTPFSGCIQVFGGDNDCGQLDTAGVNMLKSAHIRCRQGQDPDGKRGCLEHLGGHARQTVQEMNSKRFNESVHCSHV